MAFMSQSLAVEPVQRALIASGYVVQLDGICGPETYEAFSDWVLMHIDGAARMTWACSGRRLTLMGEDWQVHQVAWVLADLAGTVRSGTRIQPTPGTRVQPGGEPVADSGLMPTPADEHRRRLRVFTAVGVIGAGALVAGLAYAVYKGAI